MQLKADGRARRPGHGFHRQIMLIIVAIYYTG
jgi:hypothetical protein